jgi:hypothetical protein
MNTHTAMDVREAAGVLGITDGASLNEIRHRYRELMKKWHPDVAEGDTASSHRTVVTLNGAYELLFEYCTNHRFSFRLEDIKTTMEKTPGEYWMERFGDDPLWS